MDKEQIEQEAEQLKSHRVRIRVLHSFCRKCYEHTHDVYCLTLPFAFTGEMAIFCVLLGGLLCLFMGQSVYEVVFEEV